METPSAPWPPSGESPPPPPPHTQCVLHVNRMVWTEQSAWLRRNSCSLSGRRRGVCVACACLLHGKRTERVTNCTAASCSAEGRCGLPGRTTWIRCVIVGRSLRLTRNNLNGTLPNALSVLGSLTCVAARLSSPRHTSHPPTHSPFPSSLCTLCHQLCVVLCQSVHVCHCAVRWICLPTAFRVPWTSSPIWSSWCRWSTCLRPLCEN